MYYDDDRGRYILELPHECPKCGDDLKLDEYPDGTTFLVCENKDCEYKLDATEEFKKLREAQDDDIEDEH